MVSFQSALLTLFCLAGISTTISGSCSIGDRYGGEWDGVQEHRYRTDDSLDIEGNDVIGTVNDVTNVYTCKESDEYETVFLLLTTDKSGYNCLSFYRMADSMVQYGVATKNGSFDPIEVPEGYDVTLEYLCDNGNILMRRVIDIARKLD
ncbi:uncharacterized protein LOC132558319 [Ylistrum balloti]|uniref:uncharacterized protein LOC132558319 n=1 Tax=Ylistrum balloti TaxID=509963 RepID=UPI00290595E6|nr:uncharacterized protein LOC132558319 [Ylistrum balloti]